MNLSSTNIIKLILFSQIINNFTSKIDANNLFTKTGNTGENIDSVSLFQAPLNNVGLNTNIDTFTGKREHADQLKQFNENHYNDYADKFLSVIDNIGSNRDKKDRIRKSFIDTYHVNSKSWEENVAKISSSEDENFNINGNERDKAKLAKQTMKTLFQYVEGKISRKDALEAVSAWSEFGDNVYSRKGAFTHSAMMDLFEKTIGNLDGLNSSDDKRLKINATDSEKVKAAKEALQACLLSAEGVGEYKYGGNIVRNKVTKMLELTDNELLNKAKERAGTHGLTSVLTSIYVHGRGNSMTDRREFLNEDARNYDYSIDTLFKNEISNIEQIKKSDDNRLNILITDSKRVKQAKNAVKEILCAREHYLAEKKYDVSRVELAVAKWFKNTDNQKAKKVVNSIGARQVGGNFVNSGEYNLNKRGLLSYYKS